jgi:hypothetical protein
VVVDVVDSDRLLFVEDAAKLIFDPATIEVVATLPFTVLVSIFVDVA